MNNNNKLLSAWGRNITKTATSAKSAFETQLKVLTKIVLQGN